MGVGPLMSNCCWMRHGGLRRGLTLRQILQRRTRRMRRHSRGIAADLTQRLRLQREHQSIRRLPLRLALLRRLPPVFLQQTKK